MHNSHWVKIHKTNRRQCFYWVDGIWDKFMACISAKVFSVSLYSINTGSPPERKTHLTCNTNDQSPQQLLSDAVFPMNRIPNQPTPPWSFRRSFRSVTASKIVSVRWPSRYGLVQTATGDILSPFHYTGLVRPSYGYFSASHITRPFMPTYGSAALWTKAVRTAKYSACISVSVNEFTY